MIGLDTNILARLVAQDDSAQSAKTDALMASLTPEEPGWISTASVLELVWVMTSRFGMRRPDIYRMLDGLLKTDKLVIEHAGRLRKTIDMFRLGNADFADCLISVSCRDAGCTATLTFDRDAAKTAAMTLIQ
jgi:predicted nucleic-acid-binding protein